MRSLPGLTFDALAPDQAVRVLVRAFRRGPVRGPVVRVEVPVTPVDALAWLHAQPFTERVYWHGRGADEVLAGVGAADVVEADSLEALEAALGPRLSTLPAAARYLGAARFAPTDPITDEWSAFGRVRFVLPRVELRVTNDEAMLAAHLLPGRDDPKAVAEELEQLAWPTWPTAEALPLPVARTDAPDAAGWNAAVTWALGAFRTTPLDKVVLARRTRFMFDEPLDPYALLRQLEATTPACYHALIGVGDAAFLSATPERLLYVEGSRFDTEAVAGTRPRSVEAAGDRRLLDELLGSEKDRREQAFVRKALVEALDPLAATLEAGAEPSALTLAHGRHLRTGLRGRLRPGTSPLDVLRALHPTPAVGGTPREEALAALRQLEPFDRGLYAGPIGWVGPNAAEFAVGIRSGLVHGHTLDLYAGAGIVAGSEPETEWAEIEHKIGGFARVLGLV
ncbi:MAG: isochorismate synthase [Rhodothermaceae bacterium]|nr:isochorismate synthase [Rhodothermaceae bacterium]